MADKYPRIDVTVDAVVFGYLPEKKLQILLIRRKKEPFKDSWAIPGGFVEADEQLESAAARELQEETGITLNKLEQVYTFGDPHRDPRKRVVSIAHYAVVKVADHQPRAGDDAGEVSWFDIDNLPRLAFDHFQIVKKCVEHLKDDLKKRESIFLKTFNETELAEMALLVQSS